MPASEPSTELTLAQSRIAALEAELSAARAERDDVKAERDTLREAYTTVKLELELLKRRLFVVKGRKAHPFEMATVSLFSTHQQPCGTPLGSIDRLNYFRDLIDK